jgi:hypothetical protein
MLDLLFREAGRRSELPQGTSEALDLAYELSHEKEEGRWLKFVFVLSKSRQTLPALLKLANAVSEREGLRRLCLATDPDLSCLHIEFDKRARCPSVVGVLGRPGLEPEPFEGGFADYLVLIEATDPGRLSLSAGAMEVKFDGSRYYRPNGSERLRPIVPRSIAEAIAAYPSTPVGDHLPLGARIVRVDVGLLEVFRGDFEKELADSAPRVASDTVEMLVRSVRHERHGGTLIFSSFPVHRNGGVDLPDGLVIEKYELMAVGRQPALPAPWNSGMLDFLGLYCHRQLAERGITVLDLESKFQGPEGLRSWVRDVCSIRLQAAHDEWKADVGMCARLAHVDGAVVFDAMLNPRFFGAKIDLRWAGRPELEDRLHLHGTRVRSAASAAAALPGSLALAISQDGPVTAFWKDADGSVQSVALEF